MFVHRIVDLFYSGYFVSGINEVCCVWHRRRMFMVRICELRLQLWMCRTGCAL